MEEAGCPPCGDWPQLREMGREDSSVYPELRPASSLLTFFAFGCKTTDSFYFCNSFKDLSSIFPGTFPFWDA